MKRLNGDRMRLLLVGVVAAIVVSGGTAKADFTFGVPTNFGSAFNTSGDDMPDCFSADGLELYITSDRSGGLGLWDLWVAKRKTVNGRWSTPVNLGSLINTSIRDAGGCISADGLELCFQSRRSGGYGGWDIWITRRAAEDDAWGRPQNLGPVINSTNWDGTPWLSPDELELYFYSMNRAGGYGDGDIWVSTRLTRNDPWGEPVNLGPTVNSSACEIGGALSPDGLLLFFSEDIIGPLRPGGLGGSDLWVTRRTTVFDPWGVPVNLGPIVNSAGHDCGPRISPDGSTLYFCSKRPGGFGGPFYGDIWQAPIIPIVDLNRDGIIDSADMRIMVDHWGTDNSLCDIGPMPWGDGIVDVEDLKVISEYLLGDMQSIAHFKFDETKGTVANDSARNRDGTVYGSPQWQPNGGVNGGALKLDGVDDYVRIESLLNPANGALSVFAWIKGGAPGQVVLSQIGASNWLCLDSAQGSLMTELKPAGRGGVDLVSQRPVADGDWHRIGLVWDGSCRYLYVDGVEVGEAIGTSSSLESSDGGLCLGAGGTLTADTFFTGLIDDVRIYDRAVSP